MGFVTPVIGLVGLFLLFKKERNLFYYISACLAGSYLGIAFLNKVLFPRYLIFIAAMLLLTAAFALRKLVARKLATALFAIAAAGIFFNYPIIFDYANIPFPPVDRGQYLEAWPAGWGIREIVDYARAKSAEKPVLLVGEGNFGMSGDVLDSSLKSSDNIGVSGYWPLDDAALKKHQTDLESKHVYVVFSHRSDFPKDWPIRLIRKFEKPGGKSAIYLFELLP
jgi:hypothetical protein